jgi:hypothetical protein
MSSASLQETLHEDLDTALGERYYKDSKALEEKYTSEIVEAIGRAIEGHFKQGRGPARRDAHAFDNGCVRAIFRVDPDLGAGLQHGVFQPGREYRAWIRFSNGNSERRPAWFFDARGMAIKLTGVAGAKLLDDEKNTQDFVLISHPRFFVDDLERYKATLEDFLRGGYWDQYVKSLFRLRLLSELPLAFRANLNFMSNPLFQQYWSMTPYRLGLDPGRRFAVKYTAKPRIDKKPGFFRRHATRLGWNFSLKQEMNDTLAGNEVWFDFYIQRYVDRRTPIEDSKVEWTEDVSKPEHVAKIIIPIQDCISPEQDFFCENLSFSPWHGLLEHRPLGLVNRVRKVAYRRISELRHELNHAPRIEPTGGETFDTRHRVQAEVPAQLSR